MRTAFDLSPLFRSTVGFDRLGDLFDTAMRVEEQAVAYPPYNIEKLGEDAYSVTMAVAGFKDEEIEITAQQNMLLVTGRVQEEAPKETRTFLHKGIATRAFERRFSLADHVKVDDAKLENGLLTISLKREIPEAYKPRQIAVNGKSVKKLEGKKAA